MSATNLQNIYAHFANLLDYPDDEIFHQTKACATDLAAEFPDAFTEINHFLSSIQNTSISRMEEIYTSTFDINPTCYIFAGYMLFGESFNRGKFLVRLQEEYASRGFSIGNELADHLAIMFRFYSTLDANELLALQLRDDCFRPVLNKMYANFKDMTKSSNPYRHLLRAILKVIDPEIDFESAMPPAAEILQDSAAGQFLKSRRSGRLKEEAL